MPSTGNWTSAQINPITNSTHFDRTRLTTKPVTTAEIEKSRKKLEPTIPNCFGVKLSSVMIGTPASPIMALSAKLISMKKNRRAMIFHAPFSESNASHRLSFKRGMKRFVWSIKTVIGARTTQILSLREQARDGRHKPFI